MLFGEGRRGGGGRGGRLGNGMPVGLRGGGESALVAGGGLWGGDSRSGDWVGLYVGSTASC